MSKSEFHHSSTLTWTGYWDASWTSHCRASAGSVKVADFYTADDAAIFAESLEVMVMPLEALHEEAKSLCLNVSWANTTAQVFEGLQYEAVRSVHVCAESIEIPESITYLDSTVHKSRGFRQEVL